MTAAPTGRLLGALSSTFEIRAHGSLRVSEAHCSLLSSAIRKVSSFERMIPVNVDMGNVVGESPLVVVRPDDRLFWALTEGDPNRPQNWIRVAGNRTAEPTSIVGLQMYYERMHGSDDFPYDGRLIAWSFGPFPLPTPAPDYQVNLGYLRQLIAFWRKHAYAASALCDRMIVTRTDCPWGVEW